MRIGDHAGKACSRTWRRPERARGFTYLGILLAVAFIGAILASAGIVWHTAQQREHESELLFVGDHIRQAIGNYYNAGAPKQFPAELKDLLRDPRRPDVVRYLRKLYIDPITGTDEWGLIKTADDRIAGVFSRSEKHPIKQANFNGADQDFTGKEKYSEWAFVYHPASRRSKIPALLTTPTFESGKSK